MEMNKLVKTFIRPVEETDAKPLADIYAYYVDKTAVTFEWDPPSALEFKNRIRTISMEYPFLVLEAEIDGGKTVIGYAYASSLKGRTAYDWCVESSIYIHKDFVKCGAGRLLLTELEKILCERKFLNVYACIAKPVEEDEFLTKGSMKFHEKMGYKIVGEFHSCGYKFNRWYNVVWMEKILANHLRNQPKPVFK